jgi:membrane protease YdiL (CAAX protease family)/uncharacterized RDD family membrane protein YckC
VSERGFVHGGRRFEYATVGRRALAALLDNLVWVVGIGLFVPGELFEDNETAAAILVLALLTAWFNYFAICEWRLGQTIGKNATGITVLREDGARMSWNAAAIRNVLRIVDLPLAALGIGLLMMERSPRRQRLGDRLARTLVVREAEDAQPSLPEQRPEAVGEEPPEAEAPVPDSSPSFPFATWGPRRAVAGGLIGLAAGALFAPLLILPFDPDLATDDPTVGGLLAAQALLEICLVGAALWVAVGADGPSVGLREALGRLGIRAFRASAFKWLGLAMLVYYALTIAYGVLIIEPEQEDVARDLGLDTGVAAAIGAVVLIAIVAPIAEELFFRGMLFGGLRKRLSPLLAALISGAVFGAVHAATGVSAIPPLILFGVVLALLYERTGSLVPGIIGHVLNNGLALSLTA